MHKFRPHPAHLAALLAASTAACDDVEHPGGGAPHDQEVITTVELAFAPTAGGDALLFRWADPEADGSPTVDEVTLQPGDYTLTVRFLDALQVPPEDLGDEIAHEAEEHQVFFTGTAVEGPATGPNPGAPLVHAYADQDANGLPIGLTNAIAARGAATGELVVTLRHLPAEGGAAKGPGLAETVAAEGFAAIGGDDDVQVTFPVAVP